VAELSPLFFDTLSSNADDVFIMNNGCCGITIQAGPANWRMLAFGDYAKSDTGSIVYDNSDDSMTFRTNAGVIAMVIGSSQNVDAPTGDLTAVGEPTV